MGVLSLSTILCHQGFVTGRLGPFLIHHRFLLPPLCSIPFHSLPPIRLLWGSSGGIG
jgi:hypothetical protein